MHGVNPNQAFISDFQICHLHNLLTRQLGCGSFENDQNISWFAKNWRYIPAQKTQFDFNQAAREEVINHVGKHRLKIEPPKVVRDQPQPPTWTPCQHWGGSRVCENCKHTSHVAGVMARAEALWQENSKFVRFHVNNTLNKRGQRVTQEGFDDLVSGVWHRVTKVIDSFKDPGNGTQRRAWLKQQVAWTVSDHFRDSMRAKRDVRREDSFEAVAADTIAAGG